MTEVTPQPHMPVFYYTRPQKIMHRVFSEVKVEGESTACGLKIRKGWPWFLSRKGYPVCKRCAKATSQALVEAISREITQLAFEIERRAAAIERLSLEIAQLRMRREALRGEAAA